MVNCKMILAFSSNVEEAWIIKKWLPFRNKYLNVNVASHMTDLYKQYKELHTIDQLQSNTHVHFMKI